MQAKKAECRGKDGALHDALVQVGSLAARHTERAARHKQSVSLLFFIIIIIIGAVFHHHSHPT